MTGDGLIVDLFAGPGGWSEGLRLLGLTDVGLEWDAAACATRAAAGHPTVRVDVSTFRTETLAGRVAGLIASPPCTLFSEGGTRIGRLVLDLLAEGIRRLLAGDDCRQEIRDRVFPVALAEQQTRNRRRSEAKRWDDAKVEAAARQDAFIACLVLEPARFLHTLLTATDRTTGLGWVAFEQVPSVLPLWETYAAVLREMGWSVWAGVLCAADYGVGQARHRAVLIGSATRRVQPPEPTHAEDGGVVDLFGGCRLRWRTMADTLGWGYTDRPAPTVTADDSDTGGTEPFGNRSRKAMQTAMQNRDHWAWKKPAPTVGCTVGHVTGKQANGHLNLEPEEGAALQSFRRGYPFQGNKGQRSMQIGNAMPPLLAAHVVAAAAGLPAPAAGSLGDAEDTAA